jgi:hypothetical protein
MEQLFLDKLIECLIEKFSRNGWIDKMNIYRSSSILIINEFLRVVDEYASHRQQWKKDIWVKASERRVLESPGPHGRLKNILA